MANNSEVLEVISPRNWWKNLRGENTQVSVLLQGQWYRGVAETFHGDETVAAGYLRAMHRSPSLIRMYHVQVDEIGQPKPELDLATSLNNLAAFYHKQRTYVEAEPLYQRAFTIREQQLGPHHADTVFVLKNLVDCYREQGKMVEAEAVLLHSPTRG
ncbi:hypothetical protein KDA_47220 [Dictyobacter alpinus]|uniref:Uncharacterized protein n=1 Tax=Dictyobacter alpinus TaxID=2014873 RepID=A0A402BCW5_9CHLR|nr:tetratricopeptide repeat protein [Dictyobacter alpinus]GCE29238.1 hypothetical protein KDA_47220 [Dictyobacter alpinus]